MAYVLSAESLMVHVRALADEIGPRPAGHIEEMRARQYVRCVLADLGYAEVESLPFLTPDTWGYALGLPLGAALLSNLLGGKQRRWGWAVGGALTLASAYLLWRSMHVDRQPLSVLAPRQPSATLIARAPASQERRRVVVILAHTDTNKARPMFKKEARQYLLPATTAGFASLVSNGLAQLGAALLNRPLSAARAGSVLALGAALGLTLAEERGGYVPGANDNASAVAVALGLAAHLQAQPLKYTEVWLAFTGAEEVGALGAHALLDVYGEALRDAWFLDLEMVGSHEIGYVSQHSGFSYVSTYYPDPDSVAWVEATARRHPECGVQGHELVIGEEVGALRSRGYRGVCLVGVGPDGWLENWHRPEDGVAHLAPEGLEKAAHFAWYMLQEGE